MQEEKKSWLEYSKRMETKKHFVVLKGENVIGVFPTLTSACDYLKDKKFHSYWTITRSNNWVNGRRGVKRYKVKGSDYSIQQAPHSYSA